MRECDLCGEFRPVTLALLRVAWSDEIATAAACSTCSARAWRTIGEISRAADLYSKPISAWISLEAVVGDVAKIGPIA